MSESGTSAGDRGLNDAPQAKPNGSPFSDSFSGVTLASTACAACGADVAVAGGGCLKCLLRVALDEDEQSDGAESLETLLAEIDVPDTDWRLGNYQVLEEIGRGGMGVIYRARQRHSKRIVALKRVLRYNSDSRETLERFRREAEAAASLDHPNILPIYEVGMADGLPFFTMKLATGGSLQRAGRAGIAEPRECVRLLAKVAHAVAYAHRHGILHRDLKPGNILLDASGEPLVSDFGLAKWIDATTDLTRSLAIFGTPGFIAPEQACGTADALTPAADVYSLGAILFHLLAGRPPFLGEHAIAVIQQAAEQAAPKLRRLKPSLDRDLETICAKCLEREPQARYRSAAEVAEDFERWLAGRPIIARPVSAPAKLWRWSKRNPVLAGLSIVALLIGALAVTRQVDSWRLHNELREQLAEQHSIEVAPLLDLDLAETSEEVARGLATQLEQQLGRIGPARVTVGNSVTPATQPRTDLPRAVLSGTTRIVAGKRRISVHLLDGKMQTPLWHKTYEDDPSVVTATAARLAARDLYQMVSGAEPSSVSQRVPDPGLTDPEARKFIDQGVELAFRRSGQDVERSIACLREAIALQPRSSAAWAALARAIGFKAAFGSTRDPLPEALACARNAVGLDPSNPEAHLVLAALLQLTGNTRDAIEEAFVTLELSPTSWRAANLLANVYKISRPDLALVWMEIGKEPGSDIAGVSAGIADCFAHLLEDSRAEPIYERYLKLHPEQPGGWIGICRLRLLNNRIDEARALYRREIKGYTDFAYAAQMAAQVEFFARDFDQAGTLYGRLHEQQPAGGVPFYGAISYASALGRIKIETDPIAGRDLLESARRNEQRVVEEAPDQPGPLYCLAAIEASLGQTEAALARLQAAVAAGWIDYRSMQMDPRFDSIRREPLYSQLREAMAQRVAWLRKRVPAHLLEASAP